MHKRIITLGGLPGSGKSTVKKLIAEKLGYTMLSTGDFVREMAHARNLTLEEFNDLIIHDKTLDEEIDSRLIAIEGDGDRYVVDSHLAFHFIPSGFSVLLTVSLETSEKRIFNDSSSPIRIKSGDTMKINNVQKKSDNLLKRRYLFTVNFALNNKTSEVAPYLALNEIYNANIKLLDTINNSLAAHVKTSKYGKDLQQFIDAIKKNEK